MSNNEAISAVSNVNLKKADRDELKKLMDVFIAKGGKIDIVPPGACSVYNPTTPANQNTMFSKEHEAKMKTLADVADKHCKK